MDIALLGRFFLAPMEQVELAHENSQRSALVVGDCRGNRIAMRSTDIYIRIHIECTAVYWNICRRITATGFEYNKHGNRARARARALVRTTRPVRVKHIGYISMSSLLEPPLPLLKTTIGTRDDGTFRKRTSIRVPEARGVIAATREATSVQSRKQIE